MKKVIFSLIVGLMLVANSAWAKSAEPFDGWYEIISRSQSENPDRAEFFRVDVDTLLNIWLKYGEEGKPIPPDWEPVKGEIAIFAAFTNRDYLSLSLEKNAVVTGDFLGVYSRNGDVLEIRRRADGRFDMAIQENEQVSRYLLAAPRPMPNPLRLPVHLR